MFTPEELENRSFVMVRRGYDPDEVGAFLRAVADDVRRLSEDMAAAKRDVDPLDSAMADAVAVVQAARESAARIESQAQQRAAARLQDAEDEVARRLERARVEAEKQLAEAREQAMAIVAEANARKTAAEAEIVAAKNTWLREAAQLDILGRRRRRLLEEAHDSLEQWMSALREIVEEARASGDEADDAKTAEMRLEITDASTAYPDEPVAEVPAQESAEDQVVESVEAEHEAAVSEPVREDDAMTVAPSQPRAWWAEGSYDGA